MKLELMLFVLGEAGVFGQLMPLVQKSPLHWTPGKLGNSIHEGPLQWKFSENPLPTPQSVNCPLTVEPILMMMLCWGMRRLGDVCAGAYHVKYGPSVRRV